MSTLVIFDCDGVLVDSEVISIEIDRKMILELGWDISRQEVIDLFVGKSHANFINVVESYFGRKIPDDWESSYDPLFRQACAEQLQPIDGIRQALTQIDIATCVASNGTHEKMEFTLGLTGLLEKFKGRMFSATQVENAKPAPDLFLYAAARLGYRPDECIVVEDSSGGVAAGLAANMKVIGYAGGLTRRDQIEQDGVLIIDHMSQLPSAIDQLTAG